MHTFSLSGPALEWPYASNQHFTTVTHRSLQLTLEMYNREGYLYTHYTCSPAHVQHAWHNIKWHNTKLHNTVIIMVNTKVKSANIASYKLHSNHTWQQIVIRYQHYMGLSYRWLWIRWGLLGFWKPQVSILGRLGQGLVFIFPPSVTHKGQNDNTNDQKCSRNCK